MHFGKLFFGFATLFTLALGFSQAAYAGVNDGSSAPTRGSGTPGGSASSSRFNYSGGGVNASQILHATAKGGGTSSLFPSPIISYQPVRPRTPVRPVPELSTLVGFGGFVGLGGLAALRRRKMEQTA